MDNSLRICLLNDSFPPTIDGVSNTVMNYANILTEKGDSVSVATPAYPGVKDDYPFPVIRYNSLNTVRFAGYRAGIPIERPAIRRLSETAPQILHSHCPVASTVLARVVRETTGAPIVFTYHTKFDIDIKNLIRLEILQETAIRCLCDNITACDEVWVVSRGAGENLRTLGYDGDYIVMENGVDLPKGRVSDDEVLKLRRLHNIPDGVPVFLFVGRLMWYKGIKIILDALKKLKESGMDFRMIFVGDGMDRKEIEAYTEELSLSDTVCFPGAVSDREVIRAYFCLGDLFLFPSTFDTNGLVVREAAACALASVLVKGSCAAEGITHMDTGFLAEENADSYAAILKELSENKDLMKKVGQNAQDKIYISWEDSVLRARERYFTVLENYNKSGRNTHRKIRSDEFIELVGNINSKFDKLHSAVEEAGVKSKNISQNLWSLLDRYL